MSTSDSPGWRVEAAETLRLLAQWLDDGAEISVTGYRDIEASGNIIELHCKIHISDRAYFVKEMIPAAVPSFALEPFDQK